jgi:hypothetical protein
MFDFWFKNWRRKRWYREAPQAAELQHLRSNLWFFDFLREPQQQRLAKMSRQFVREKSFEGMRGLAIDDVKRWTVAGAACLMLLGFSDHFCFDRVRSIILYPKSIRLPQTTQQQGGDQPWVSGVYSRDVAVILSWEHAAQESRHFEMGRNVVIHEFAHHIDELDGSVDGDPPLPSRRLSRHWREIAQLEYRRLEAAARSGEPTVLDAYGLENRAEFFAVAVEAFFCNTLNLADFHPQLYELLQTLFQLDPREWLLAPEGSKAGP